MVRANERDNSQHCWRSYTLTGFKLNWLTPNNTQQRATGCANGRKMYHPTMLGVALKTKFFVFYLPLIDFIW